MRRFRFRPRAPDRRRPAWEAAFDRALIETWTRAIEAASADPGQCGFCAGRIHRQAIRAAIAEAARRKEGET